MAAPLTWNQTSPTTLRWNGIGLTWNGVVAQPNKRMPKIALNLQDLTDEELIQEARNIAGGIIANAADYTGVDPTPVEINAAADAAEAGLTDHAAKQLAAQAATEAKNNLLEVVRGKLTDVAGWGELKVKDAAKLMKVFTLKKSPTATTAIPQINGLAVTFGDNAGELDVVWEPEQLAKSYELQCRYLVNGNGNAPFTHARTVTGSKATLKQLNTAQVIQLRARAIGPRGLEGPWSDVAEHLVP